MTATRKEFRDYRSPQRSSTTETAFQTLKKVLEKETNFIIGGKTEIHRLLEDVKVFCTSPESSPVVTDIAYVVQRYELIASGVDYQQSIFSSIISLEAAIASQQIAIENQALAVVSQAHDQSVRQLAKIAFVFIPPNFIPSIFGTNIDFLGTTIMPWWAFLIGVGGVAFLVFLVWFPGWFKQGRRRMRKVFEG